MQLKELMTIMHNSLARNQPRKTSGTFYIHFLNIFIMQVLQVCKFWGWYWWRLLLVWASRGCWLNLEEVRRREKNIFPRGQRQVTETVPVHMMAATRGSLTCGSLTPDLASLCSCISLVLQKNFFFSRKILVAKPAMNIIPAAQEWEWDLVEFSRPWTGVFFIHFSFRTDIKMSELFETKMDQRIILWFIDYRQ